jgi:hypothetical protein
MNLDKLKFANEELQFQVNDLTLENNDMKEILEHHLNILTEIGQSPESIRNKHNKNDRCIHKK